MSDWSACPYCGGFHAQDDTAAFAVPSGGSVANPGGWYGALIQGSRWDFYGSKTLTYAFYDTDDYYWLEYGKELMRTALNQWDRIIDVSFVEVYPSGAFYNSGADMAFWISDYSLFDYGTLAMAGFPDNWSNTQLLSRYGLSLSDYPTIAGDVIFNYYAPGQLDPGGLIFYAALHEIGHALGLKHPHDNGGSGRPTFTQAGFAEYDSGYFTVMSYNSPGTTWGYNHPFSPMVMDIAVAQYLYGANMSTNAGNNTYTLGPTDRDDIGALWDAGGYDVIDGSQMTTGFELDLFEGGYLSYGQGNYYGIAFGVTLEEVRGGSGTDTIGGNNAGNRITTGHGSDSVWGYDGGDYISASGTSGNKYLHGGNQGDTIIGGNGNDEIRGGKGLDYLSGGSGNDTIYSGLGRDTLIGGSGSDVFVVRGYDPKFPNALLRPTIQDFQAGQDTIVIEGVSVIEVQAALAAQTSSGNSVILEVAGAMITVTGTTRLFSSEVLTNIPTPGATITGTDATDFLVGTLGDDMVNGGLGNDTIRGLDGNDTINGAEGNDDLNGGNGNDYIIGGSGNDTMTGGAGSDRFHFGSGSNVITDYEVGLDSIDDTILSTSLTSSGIRLIGIDGSAVLTDVWTW